MSQWERDRLDWLKRARDSKMTQREAAERMEVSERWVRKLLRRMKKQGDSVVIHGLRGRTSNRKIAAQTREAALAMLRGPDWHDFGPTFAAEQLGKRRRIEVGKETLRGWMIEGELWKPGSRHIREIRILAGMECALRQTGGRVPQPSPAAERAPGPGGDPVPRRAARHRQRLHVLVSPAGAIRSCARRWKQGCGISGCASNSGSMAS